MDQDVVLEHFQERMRTQSAGTCSPSHRNIQQRVRKGQRTEFYLETLKGDFRELSRSYSSCLSYESVHSRTLRSSGDTLLPKRGSMYQSSKEVRRMRKLHEEMRKKQSGCRYEDFISFEIADHPKFLPLISSAYSKPSANTASSAATSSMEFLDLSFRDLSNKALSTNSWSSDIMSAKDESLAIPAQSVEGKKSHCKKVAPWLLQESGSLKEQRSCSRKMVDPQSHDGIIRNMDSLKTLPKCYSENAKMSHGVSKLDPKTILSPLKRMLLPIMKSKSVKNSPLSGTQSGKNVVIDPADTRNEMSRKSLLSEFSIMGQNIEHDACLTGGEFSTASTSPAHLHGILKLETENGNPSWGFCLQDPADVLSAKTWRTDNAFNWVYTFHRSETKLNSGRNSKHTQGDSLPLVGQMQVSCYTCSDVSKNGSSADSTITEFVLYDIARGRMNSTVEEKSKCSSGSIQSVPSSAKESVATGGHVERKNSVEHPEPPRHGFSSSESNDATSFPWLPENLHSQLEIAAIEMQIPFNRKESWKDADEFSSNKSAESTNSLNHTIVKVVTPSGAHGFPNSNESHPSSLLDRWRLGGGCDCGGWDMSCPIVVLSNSGSDNSIDHLIWQNQKPLALFVEGSKENIPALSITADGDGQYSVDFHAHLSSLQAFSICIAILHSSDVSSVLIQDKCAHSLYSNSLKLLLEEEVGRLIEAITAEEQRNPKKGVEQVPSFFIDPPFSPMGRV